MSVLRYPEQPIQGGGTRWRSINQNSDKVRSGLGAGSPRTSEREPRNRGSGEVRISNFFLRNQTLGTQRRRGARTFFHARALPFFHLSSFYITPRSGRRSSEPHPSPCDSACTCVAGLLHRSTSSDADRRSVSSRLIMLLSTRDTRHSARTFTSIHLN